jgi:two-component system, OmpR family, sensor histidine kinase KdpD
MNPIRSWSASWRYGLSIAGVALVTLILVQLFPIVHQANIALLYLLVVLISATTLGLGPAILASLLAFLAFNFFFVPPLHTLMVADRQDLLRLLTFLVVAITTSSLAGHARAQADTAARSATELAAHYGLSQGISAEVELERILPLVAQTTTHLLNVPSCSVLLYDTEGRLSERATAGQPPAFPTRRVDTFLRIGPHVLGVLRVTQRSLQEPLTPSEQERLQTIAAQVVLVLERARLVEEASQARAQAEAERIKAALLSSVSHDLRTPLAVIKGAVTNLLDDTVAWDPAAQRELLRAVNDETDRLNRLVGNLLDMSRIESGALQPTRSWQDIGELVTDVVDRMCLHLEDHSATVDIPADLPPVQVSYTQIDQVLTNLLENVVKYTPSGTPIAIQVRAERAFVQVTVRDHGPGIPAGMSARIFEKFVRLADPERHADGTGLGLAICKGIVEAHGGRIWAENPPDGGARFSFTVPLPKPSIENSAHVGTASRQTEEEG